MDRKRRAAPAEAPTHAGYYPPLVRAFVAVAFVAATVLKYGTISDNVTALWDYYMEEQRPHGIERWGTTWAHKLLTEGSVLDAPHPGHPIIPNEVAVEAAKLLAQGYTAGSAQPGDGAPNKHFWFHSIGEAVRLVPRLGEIIAQYSVDKHHLLRRIHEVQPTLLLSKVHIKALLSAPQRNLRKICAAWFLARLAADPHFLDKVVWIDQVKVWLFSGQPGSVKVWHDAHAEGWEVLVSCCGAATAKPVRLCLYAAVNAIMGLVFFQFTTDTSRGVELEKYKGSPGAVERRDPTWKVRLFLWLLHVEGWGGRADEEHDAARAEGQGGGFQRVAQRRQEGAGVSLALGRGARAGHKARAKDEQGRGRPCGPKLHGIANVLGCLVGAGLQVVHAHQPRTRPPSCRTHQNINGCLAPRKGHAWLRSEVPRPIGLHGKLRSRKPKIELAMPPRQPRFARAQLP